MMTGSPRSAVLRLLRVLAVAVLLVLLLPYLLTPLYRVIDPVSTLMLWRRATAHRVERVWIPLTAISPALPRAVIAAEDGRFCLHHGIDLGELRAAIEDADDLSDVRGGSTIAQQTAKNLFLWQGRSYVRKLLEFPLALWIDLILGKRRLMEIYLNIAEWGPNGEFGAEAGARYAFGKSARDLNPHEGALMAAILPSPARRSARRPSSAVTRLAGIYQGRAARSAPGTACIRRQNGASAALPDPL
jgi:monofunctional glycosyltransferase